MPNIITDGESYVGNRADGIILIIANDVTADGDAGDDLLVAQPDPQTMDGVSLSTDLSGGTGHDTLIASMETVGTWYEDGPDDYEPLSMSATLDGGGGDDIIRADFASTYFDQFFAIDAGGGDDRVTVSQGRYEWDDTNNAMQRSESVVRAGSGDDVISVELLNGSYAGLTDAETGASSTVHGSDGSDRLTSDVLSYYGIDAENFLYGGDGADQIVAASWSFGPDSRSGSAYNRARGGEGDDRIVMEAESHDATNSATGDAGNDTISALGRTFRGAAYNDLSGGDGDDRLTARIETIYDHLEEYTTAAVNTVEGGGGDDRITGVVSLGETFDETGDFFSELYGREGDDLITARGGFDNILVGNQGDDTLRGSGSTDRLIGGQGADVLSGGEGEDEFVFESPRGETSERDQILAFTQGEDKFDISAIDADVSQGGNQRFSFDGGTGTGRAWVEEDPEGSGSLLYADNGRGVLVVAIRDGGMGASDYEASDFLL